MISPMLRSTRVNSFFKKNLPELNFLKAVSVTMIANSEKMKMKKYHLSTTFALPLPFPFGFPHRFF